MAETALAQLDADTSTDADADADAGDPHYPKGVYEGPNPNVTVWRLGQQGEIAALSEAGRGRIIELDGETLETKRLVIREYYLISWGLLFN